MSGPASGLAGRPLVLDGSSLTLIELARVSRDPRVPVEAAPQGVERIAAGRRQIDEIARRYAEDYARHRAGESDRPPVQDYGITTGFGEFKSIPVSPDDLETLQRNILLSHACGTGYTAEETARDNYYPADVVRATLILRLNNFLKGHSGVRVELFEAVLAMVNRGIVPLVPVHGSVGSSGDLCPLAHLFVVLLGEGRYYRVEAPEDLTAWPHELRDPAAALAGDLGLEPPPPSYKEGLALVNGATFSAALLALATVDAVRLAGAADVAAALSIEATCGCARAFDPLVHAARGQLGQIDSAENLRRLLAGSRLVDAADAVQDLYSVRCAPAVHGASRDAAAYAARIAEREANAATDNPLFFPDDEPWDRAFRANWPPGYRGDERASYSAGNFHGQPVGLAADVLAIAVAELADISERRIQQLLDQRHNRNLPPNLIARPGVNSGMMLAQYCAAGIVSEGKVLAHPASVDSIPTGASSEDHNAMSTIAARKARTLVGHLEAVLAIELMVAAQAIDWRVGMERSPLGRAAPAAMDDEAERFERATADDRREAIAGRLGRGTAAAYRAVRGAARPMVRDRPLDGDIRALRRLLASGTLERAVDEAVEEGLVPVTDGPAERP